MRERNFAAWRYEKTLDMDVDSSEKDASREWELGERDVRQREYVISACI